MMVTKDGKIIRLESTEIRQTGRSTQGVRLVRMEEGDRVAAASVLPDENGKNGNGSTRRGTCCSRRPGIRGRRAGRQSPCAVGTGFRCYCWHSPLAVYLPDARVEFVLDDTRRLSVASRT